MKTMTQSSSSKPLIKKLVVIGVGLIGGSFALALKKAGQVEHVVGVGRNAENLQTALMLGLIDEAASSAELAVQGADLVLLGMPVGQMPVVMQSIAPYLAADCVVTDAGSTKSDVLAYAQQYLASHLSHFVPAHPIAGAEQSGAAAAKVDLYYGKNIVICPQADSDLRAVSKVEQAWALCGGVVQRMDVCTHDAVFAAVSHLPHLLAFALVDDIAKRDNAEQLFSFAASGFRDFTRIASSHPEMWRDISLANQGALLNEIDIYQAQLTHIRGLLAAGDGAALEEIFAHAQAKRNSWIASREQ